MLETSGNYGNNSVFHFGAVLGKMEFSAPAPAPTSQNFELRLRLRLRALKILSSGSGSGSELSKFSAPAPAPEPLRSQAPGLQKKIFKIFFTLQIFKIFAILNVIKSIEFPFIFLISENFGEIIRFTNSRPDQGQRFWTEPKNWANIGSVPRKSRQKLNVFLNQLKMVNFPETTKNLRILT